MEKTAILVDGAFFLKRYSRTFGKRHSAKKIAKNLFSMCLDQLEDRKELHRILFYDCPPLKKRTHNPVSGEAIDFALTDEYFFRHDLHQELVKLRKLALRLGRLGEASGGWTIKPRSTKELLSGKKAVPDLSPQDVVYGMTQKGVDMRIGLDIAVLAHKRLVQRIVLVTGDADFVPAAKHARREGIELILDPLWQRISEDLFEHIDGLSTKCPRPQPKL